MLQIITGKFYTSEDVYITHHRAVLYSNYRMSGSIDTVSGTISQAEMSTDVSSLVYEVDQKIEKKSSGCLVAVGVDTIAQDFATIASFVFRVTCSPDIDLVRRLTLEHNLNPSAHLHPNRFVTRVFDKNVGHMNSDPDLLTAFMRDLVALRRSDYVKALRAIHRYITGLHRIADDLTLAYTLLVASIESLSQSHDNFTNTWADYPEHKRGAIDQALKGVTSVVKGRVQRALLNEEHVAIRRRYEEFAVDNISPSFYRDEAAQSNTPARKNDLRLGLRRAYEFRSQAVHSLVELPRILTSGACRTDTLMIDGKPTLTFQGLARVAHHVIRNFVRQAPKVDEEAFDWTNDLPNTMTVTMAPECWIWNKNSFGQSTANQYLAGFLEQLAPHLLREHNPRVTDIREVLRVAEQHLANLGSPKQRRPIFCLYYLFHWFLPSAEHMPNASAIFAKYYRDFDEPSVESMLLHIITGHELGWTATELEAVYRSYLAQRYHKAGLLLPPLFELAAALTLAELCRAAGDGQKASEYLSEAVENSHANAALLEFEHHFAEQPGPIDWRAILLPKAPETASFATPANPRSDDPIGDSQI